MSTTLTVERAVHFERGGPGRGKELREGRGPQPAADTGRVPRVARLMALALHFDELIREGAIANYVALAELGHVTRARVSQIMSLLYLSPDIQEAVLFLPRTERGRDAIKLHDLMPITAGADWLRQRRMWCELNP